MNRGGRRCTRRIRRSSKSAATFINKRQCFFTPSSFSSRAMAEYTRDLTLPNIDALHLEPSNYSASSDALTIRPHLHVVTQHNAYSFPAPWQSRPTPMASSGTLTEFSSGSEYSPSSSPAAPPSPNTFNPPSVQEPACVDPVTATPQPQAHKFSPHLAPHMFVREYHLNPLPTLTPTLVSHPSQSDGPHISPIGPARRTRTYTRSTPKSSVPSSSTGGDLPEDNPALSPRTVSHPYTRIYAKRNSPPSKRRKMWNHALEKSLFTPDELANVSAPLRRTMYISSLEAHVDELHAQLLSLELYPVPFEKLEPYHGMNSKTAKSMVAGLYKDTAEMRTKLLELKRSNDALRKSLNVTSNVPQTITSARRHSISNGHAYSYPNVFGGPSDRVVMS